MELPVDFLKLRIRHMGIDLRGRDRSMSEELLDSTDIGTIGEQSSGETMPEGVGGDFFYNIRPERVFFDFIGDKEPTEPYVCVRKRLFY